MDPDAVKSTLSNLAFGNVIAAAARDLQKVTRWITSHLPLQYPSAASLCRSSYSDPAAGLRSWSTRHPAPAPWISRLARADVEVIQPFFLIGIGADFGP